MSGSKMNKNIRKFFVAILPLLVVVAANLATFAHFKNFCLFKLFFHHECWGCGLTRAVAALSHLEFEQAYDYNPLVFIILPLLFIFWCCWLREEFKNKFN